MKPKRIEVYLLEVKISKKKKATIIVTEEHLNQIIKDYGIQFTKETTT